MTQLLVQKSPLIMFEKVGGGGWGYGSDQTPSAELFTRLYKF